MGLGSGKPWRRRDPFHQYDARWRKDGYANDALATLADTLHIPVIASGGAGKMEHFRDTFSNGKADAALAASVFHFGEIRIGDLKQYLKDEGINVRI